MLDWLYVTLILCLIASNFTRLTSILQRLYAYFSRPREPQLIPYFDESGGQLIGMFRAPAQQLYRATAPASSVASTPIPTTTEGDNSRGQGQPPATVPNSRTHSPDYLSADLAQISPASSWDCWPEGKFQHFFSPQQLSDTNQLAMNWVQETLDNRGSPNASKWQRAGYDREHSVSDEALEDQVSYSGEGIISDDIESMAYDEAEQFEMGDDPDAELDELEVD
ncbi:hypothetical protein B0H16DRAFT_1719514 [Mycena metata]|uniref:Uncharacterized protein n=1 Tax=Mycena metata TaxID=1033252 RepID=A0AAD7JFE4_9AGAR|nr:hypothetical protein B0H16DRAFT_1719514 [Mycena metata]